MQQHLYKFLVLHKKLSIPKLGNFTIEKEAARYDIPSGLLFAPKPVIQFVETTEPVPDRILYDFLIAEMEVDEDTAVKAFHEFSDNFRQSVNEQRLGLLPGVGRITKGSDGGLYFTQESSLLELLPPIQLEQDMRVPADAPRNPARKAVAVQSQQRNGATEADIVHITEEEEAVIVKPDRWWIPALVLFSVGLAALLFYYL